MILEKPDDFVLFLLPQEPVVDKNAPEVVAYRLVHQRGYSGRVDAAADSGQHLLLVDLLTYVLDRCFDKACHVPLWFCAADLLRKVLQDLRAPFSVDDLWMELDSV